MGEGSFSLLYKNMYCKDLILKLNLERIQNYGVIVVILTLLILLVNHVFVTIHSPPNFHIVTFSIFIFFGFPLPSTNYIVFLPIESLVLH